MRKRIKLDTLFGLSDTNCLFNGDRVGLPSDLWQHARDLAKFSVYESFSRVYANKSNLWTLLYFLKRIFDWIWNDNGIYVYIYLQYTNVAKKMCK